MTRARERGTLRGSWPLLLACGLELALIGLLIGSLTVNGVDASSAPHGVIEYLLNRYQTLIAGLAALGAALVAVLPVYRQLTEMTRQSAAAAIPNFRVIAKEVEEEASAMKTIDRTLNALPHVLTEYDEEDWHEIYQSWPSDMNALGKELFDAWQTMSNRIDRLGAGSKEREALSAMLKRLLDRCADLSQVFRAETTGPDYEYGEQDILPDEAKRRRRAVTYAYKAWKRTYRRYVPFILAERRAAWAAVRRMERQAGAS